MSNPDSSTNITVPVLDDPSSWTPAEPSSLLFIEQANFAGVNLGAIFYGITLVLFFQCIRALLLNAKRTSPRLRNFLIGYVLVMFALGTVFTAINSHLQQLSYVNNRNFPGAGDAVPPGPLGYFIFVDDTWKVLVGNACAIVSNWLADALLMYRCFMIYNQQAFVLIFPGLLFLGSFSMGVMTLYQSSQPNASLWTKVTTNFGLPYFIIAIAMNVTLTILIAGRILFHSRVIQSALPNSSKNMGTFYGKVITILLESCAVYSISSVLFIGPYAANNAASYIFLPILSQTQIIAPFLVILRAAKNQSVVETIPSLSTWTWGANFPSAIGLQGTSTNTACDEEAGGERLAPLPDEKSASEGSTI